MRPLLRAHLSLLPFCILLASSCMSWVPANQPVPETLRQLEVEPSRTRVTLLNGARITYKAAHVVVDTLREGSGSLKGAMLQPGYAALQRGGRPIPITEVSKIEFWKLNGARTFLFVIGAGLASVYMVSNVAFVN